MSEFIIYGLVDPRTLMIRYIGQSAQGLRRPNEHKWNPGRKGTSHRWRWINQLHDLGLTYSIVVLEQVELQCDLGDREKWWIWFGKICDWPLTNMTDGGDGGAPFTGREHTEETKAKIAAGHLTDMEGVRHGMLVGISHFRKSKWWFECDCGNIKLIDSRYVRSGNTLSCGCQARKGGGRPPKEKT